MVDGVCVQDNQLKRLGQLKDPFYLALDLSWEQAKEREREAGLTEQHHQVQDTLDLKEKRKSILSRSYFYFGERIKDSSLTETGAGVGSLHYGLLVQH